MDKDRLVDPSFQASSLAPTEVRIPSESFYIHSSVVEARKRLNASRIVVLPQPKLLHDGHAQATGYEIERYMRYVGQGA